jgi:hypothetical protein
MACRVSTSPVVMPRTIEVHVESARVARPLNQGLEDAPHLLAGRAVLRCNERSTSD